MFQFTPSSSGFALLGPFASWMEETNGLLQPGDIGGPMDIGSGYRWNVPVVTYGFDQSFLDYFGTNGVAAVEGAIQILNDLPSASDIVLTNYPLDTEVLNYQAQAQNLLDLKSATLVALLEQLGLTQPTRYIFALRRWNPDFFPYHMSEYDWPDGTIPNYIVQRNFDPETLSPSQYVNGAFCEGIVIFGLRDYYLGGEEINMAGVIPVDPIMPAATAVADSSVNNLLFLSVVLSPGEFFNGLTRDDVGGLRYLLSPENINSETLLGSAHPAAGEFGDRHAHLFANGARRPGIDKLTFVPQPFDSRKGHFLPAVYRFKDFYIKNDTVMWQSVERLVTQPDFLFCAADTGKNSPYTPWVLRTGTANWLNNAALNGNTNGEGPGVIQPPITITFHKLGPTIFTGNNPYFQPTYHIFNQGWGSFDDSTNSPGVYPSGIQFNKNQLTIRLRFFDTNSPSYVQFVQLTNTTWRLHVPIGSLASLQVSTNQIDWTSLAVATNSGSVIEWYYYGTETPPKYFRVMPQ